MSHFPGNASYNAWLKTLAVGSEVAISYGHYLQMEKITRETPGRWLVGSIPYRKEDGKAVGIWAYRGYLHTPTPDVVADIEEKELQRELVEMTGAHCWYHLSRERLQQVATIFRAQQAEQAEKAKL